MTPTTYNPELISALADGQLASEDFAQALAVCEVEAQARDSWSTYHLIGDALRSPGLTAHAANAAFVARLRTRLEQEPAFVVPVPAPDAGPKKTTQPFASAQDPQPEASNDANFRWKLVAGFASVAAVAAIAWTAGGNLLALPAAPQLAQSEGSQQVLVASERGTMVRDARMQELLVAHKQFGGTSALQMPSGFLRNATFETAQGERR